MDTIIIVGTVVLVILWLVYITLDDGPPGGGGWMTEDLGPEYVPAAT